MADIQGSSKWLKLSSVMLVGQATVLAISSAGAPLRLISLLFAIALGLFLFQGSRAAWVLALVLVAVQLAPPYEMPIWQIAISVIVLGLLLAPVSRQYVWAERRPGDSSRRASARKKYASLLELEHGWAARLPLLGAEVEEKAERLAPSPRKLVWILIAWILVVLPLIGQLDKLHQGSDHGSATVDILWHVAWIGWNVGLLGLVALLAMAAHRKRGLRPK